MMTMKYSTYSSFNKLMEDWHEKRKNDMFLNIKINNIQEKRTAKSSFALEINPSELAKFIETHFS